MVLVFKELFWGYRLTNIFFSNSSGCFGLRYRSGTPSLNGGVLNPPHPGAIQLVQQ